MLKQQRAIFYSYAEKMGFLLDSITRASKTVNLDFLELRHALSSL